MPSRDFEIGAGKRPFKGYVDPPIYGRDPGFLVNLQNMRVMPGGYLEARGGFEELKPSGGTGADPISAGIYTGAHEHTMPDGYVFTATSAGTVFSSNFAQRGYWEIWDDGAEAQHDALYVGGVPQKFSRIVFTIIQALVSGGAAQTFAYEYAKTAAWDTDGNASTTGTFTTTSTPTFTSTGEQILEVAIPTDWVPAVRNGIYGYWIRIRLSAVGGGITTACRQGGARLYADWPGARQIYVASANSAAATNNGTLKFYGQSSSTQVAYTSVSTALFSGNFPRVRFASYRNILYFVNGKEQKRWDNNTLDDIGFDAPVDSATAFDVSSGTGLDGVFKYALTYGWGPEGEWGESNELEIGTATVASKDVTIDLSLSSIPDQVEKIYVYRTTDLTSVPTNSRTSFPYFRVGTISRLATGSFDTTGAFTDSSPALPFPPVELDVAVNTPPTRCRFIAVHKNRMFLGSNNQYPGRVWWSDPFEAEAFNQDENFADFTRSTGGQLTGIAEFNDQVVVFTEDQMFGIANVDQDQPSIYVIHPGIGCIAPDSIQVGFGYLVWLARNGVYVWDGEGLPRRVSDNTTVTFGKMSLETHGGSRAALHNRMYDMFLVDNNNTAVASAAATRFRYDLVTNSWSYMTIATANVKWAPMCVVTAPLGHSDAGNRHPLFAQADAAGTDYSIYLGEQTTQDDGSNFTCYADVHFGPAGDTELTIDKVYAYYNTDSGWGTPTLSMPNSLIAGNDIGSAGGTLTNWTADSGIDYRRIAAVPTQGTFGTADVVVRFSVASASGGTVNRQRLLSVGLRGVGLETQWGKS